VLGVGLVLVDQHDCVLLGHRIKAGEPTTWCLPGGHLEIGETFEQAAVREAAEEAGAVCHEPAVFAIAHAIAGVVTVGVTARATTRTIAVREPHVFDRWYWCPKDDLPDPLYPASAALLAVWLGRSAPSNWRAYPLIDNKVGQ
jgi:8-oxo-dGTP diphosphatase